MSAQPSLFPVVEPAKQRPTYDNLYLGYEADWIEANILALLSWWDTLGGVDFSSSDEFPSFARSQHDIELARRDEFKQTLRMHE